MKMKISKVLKRIEESNKIFNKASKARKRVMIAQDCIDRIKAKQISAYSGSFVRRGDIDWDTSIKDLMGNDMYTCQACAKGSLFMSYVGRVNECKFEAAATIDNDDIDDTAHMKLREIFSKEQLDLIETAFEGGSYLRVNDDIQKREAALRHIYRKYDNEDERLLAICQNIIDNDGKFKPEKIES